MPDDPHTHNDEDDHEAMSSTLAGVTTAVLDREVLTVDDLLADGATATVPASPMALLILEAEEAAARSLADIAGAPNRELALRYAAELVAETAGALRYFAAGDTTGRDALADALIAEAAGLAERADDQTEQRPDGPDSVGGSA